MIPGSPTINIEIEPRTIKTRQATKRAFQSFLNAITINGTTRSWGLKKMHPLQNPAADCFLVQTANIKAVTQNSTTMDVCPLRRTLWTPKLQNVLNSSHVDCSFANPAFESKITEPPTAAPTLTRVITAKAPLNGSQPSGINTRAVNGGYANGWVDSPIADQPFFESPAACP